MEKTIFKTFNSTTRKFETIHLDEAEVVPGMRLVKMFWCNSDSRFVTVPGASLFIIDADLNVVSCEG